MKKSLSILFVLLFASGTIVPLFAIDTCDMPCCTVEIESCCQVEKQMDCKMEMGNCDSRIFVILPSAPLNIVNQEIIPLILSFVPNLFSVIHENTIPLVLNHALIPEPPPAFNLPLLI